MTPMELLQEIRRRGEDLRRRRALQEAAAQQAEDRIRDGMRELKERFSVGSVKEARGKLEAVRKRIEEDVSALTERLRG